MGIFDKGPWLLIGLMLLIGLSGCISRPHSATPTAAMRYLPEQGEQLLNRYAPIFLVDDYLTPHNRFGAVRAEADGTIRIDPDTPILYAEQRQFSTNKAKYTNLIYRIHFSEIPAGFTPFYLTAGKNVGLILVITLDSNDLPLLYTLVYTCGCYLAFIPTSNLPVNNFPDAWSTDRQTVFGESLPGLLPFVTPFSDQQQVQIRIQPDTHRVMDVVMTTAEINSESATLASIRPLDGLKRLPTGAGQTTSFYEESGSRAGYVKDSYKLRERLLMSWWALDWRIGEDKYLGHNKDDGPVFYTSLKPWARDASDMRDFVTFLNYWGWEL